MNFKAIILANLHDHEMLLALIRAWWRLSPAQLKRCQSKDLAWSRGQAEDIVLSIVAAFGLGYMEHQTQIVSMHAIARQQIGA